MILARSGFDELFPRLVKERDAVWVNAGILPDAGIAELRSANWDLSTWSSPLTNLVSEIGTVRLHHPDQVIWVEAAAT